MRFDDTSPVEFIFGKLPRSLEPRISKITQPNSPTRLELELWLNGLIYGLITLFYVSFSSFELLIFDTNFSLEILGYVFVSSLVASWKYNVQLKRYGPDIRSHKHFSYGFMFIQTIILHTLTGVVLIGSLLVFSQLKFIHPFASLVLIAVLGYLTYTRIVSSMALVSAGLGIGLFSSTSGISTISYNFKTLNQVNGSKDFILSTVRLVLWILVWSIHNLSIGISMQFVIILVYSFIVSKYERKNASSLMMQIRAIIQFMSPSSLPQSEFDESHSFLLQDQFKKLSKIPAHKKWQPMILAKNTSEDILTPSKEDLTPIAARSMNRIASSIMNEE